MQDIKLNPLKLKVTDSFEKDEKITLSFDYFNPEDIINKDYLDKIKSKIEGHISFIKKDYNEFKVDINKQSEEEVSIE